MQARTFGLRVPEVRILENIPRLYSARECGPFWGWMYQGGSLLAECMATRRIAGRSAAAEKTWDS